MDLGLDKEGLGRRRVNCRLDKKVIEHVCGTSPETETHKDCRDYIESPVTEGWSRPLSGSLENSSVRIAVVKTGTGRCRDVSSVTFLGNLIRSAVVRRRMSEECLPWVSGILLSVWMH